jgi:LacI family transcriptional regulator
MRGSDQVSTQRIEQIRRIAQEMGYFPRAAGQMLRNRKTGYLGLILAAQNPDTAVSSGFMGPILARFIRIFSESQTPYLVDFHHHQSAEHTMPRQVASGLVDGVLIVGDVGSELTEALRQRAGFPWVSIGEYSDYCVLNDADDAIDLAVEHLHELGHLRIAYAGGPDMYQEHLESRLAFEKATQQHNIMPAQDDWIQAFSHDDDSPEYAQIIYAWASQILTQTNRPTAILCRSEPIARTVLYAAAKLGLDVPGELSVISWGCDQDATRRYPHLTTLAYNIDQIVSHAMELIQRQLKKDGTVPTTHRVPMRLQKRQTTGKCHVK